jgi:hypothetical protein
MTTKAKATAPITATKTVNADDRKVMPSHMIALIKGTSVAASDKREAWDNLAALVYSEGSLRSDVIRALSVALGDKPTDTQLAAARNAAIAARIASRMANADLPTGATDKAGRLALGHALATGEQKKKSPAMVRAYGAAREYWSKLLADAGIGQAEGQDEKNAKKPKAKPGAAGKTAQGAAPAAPLIMPEPAPLPPEVARTAKDALHYLSTQSRALKFYAQKNAGVMSSDMMAAVDGFANALGAIAKAQADAPAKPAKPAALVAKHTA